MFVTDKQLRKGREGKQATQQAATRPIIPPDRPFHNVRASKSVDRRFRTAQSPLINIFRSSNIQSGRKERGKKKILDVMAWLAATKHPTDIVTKPLFSPIDKL